MNFEGASQIQEPSCPMAQCGLGGFCNLEEDEDGFQFSHIYQWQEIIGKRIMALRVIIILLIQKKWNQH